MRYCCACAGKPTKLTYSAAAPLTTDRGDHSCWIAPDSTQAYCMGGFSSLAGFDTPLDTVEMYDATTNTWTGKKPMPTARGDFALVSHCSC
jgi:Kelch motif